ncbi:MAG: hypothetical protein ACYC2U_07315, partial [Candidatus Amoebophilus sp.]
LKYVLPYELEKQFHEEMEEEVKKVREESKKKIKESLEKGLKQGEEIGIEKIAKQMLQDETPIEYIVKWTGLSTQEIEKFKKE